MKLKNKNISKMSILFYIVAGLLMVGFLLTVYNVTVYIMSIVAEGSITFTANWMDIILYYVNNTFVFLGLSVIVFGLGYGIQLLKNMSIENKVEDIVEEIQSQEIEELVEA